jgi:hypothetical protein
LSSDVGIATAVGIEEAGVLAVKALDICWYNSVLV